LGRQAFASDYRAEVTEALQSAWEATAHAYETSRDLDGNEKVWGKALEAMSAMREAVEQYGTGRLSFRTSSRHRVRQMRRIAAYMPYELEQPFAAADNALNEAHNQLTQLARELEWLPPSSPNANDVARIQMAIRKASDDIFDLGQAVLEALRNDQ
jgi:hypothetical protein